MKKAANLRRPLPSDSLISPLKRDNEANYHLSHYRSRGCRLFSSVALCRSGASPVRYWRAKRIRAVRKNRFSKAAELARPADRLNIFEDHRQKRAAWTVGHEHCDWRRGVNG